MNSFYNNHWIYQVRWLKLYHNILWLNICVYDTADIVHVYQSDEYLSSYELNQPWSHKPILNI
jgi:hypothetical protein